MAEFSVCGRQRFAPWRWCMLIAAVASSPSPLRAQAPVSQESLVATFSRWNIENRLVGVAVAVVDSGAVTATAGSLRHGTDVPVIDSTVWQIGSLTKVFTGTLLAVMVLRHEVALDDPISRYLPGWTVPQFRGRAITLLDLATQSSGLPRLPTNFAPADSQNPYADYDETRLRSFLASYALTREPGTQYEYSNLGMGLLGFVLAKRAGKTYEVLLRERVLDPLGMRDTRVVLNTGQRMRLATGHDAKFAPTPDWQFSALQGAGALYSTLDDMVRFASAVRNRDREPLGAAISFAMTPRRSTSGSDSIGLAWQYARSDSMQMWWHNGGTAGFRSWLSFAPASRRVVIALANGGGVAIDNVGRGLQLGQPLIALPSIDPPTAISLSPGLLAPLAGRYEVTPQFVITVTQHGDTLWAQATGQDALPIFPESESTFFYRTVPAELVFIRDESGRPTGLVLQQNGAQIPARKVH